MQSFLLSQDLCHIVSLNNTQFHYFDKTKKSLANTVCCTMNKYVETSLVAGWLQKMAENGREANRPSVLVLGGKQLFCLQLTLSYVIHNAWFLADRTNGRAYATVWRPSVCRLSSSVTLCIVAKRYVLEQKLLLRAYRKSYMRNQLVPKWMTLTFV